MVYQEDVIKVAHHFAGLDMGEADILRRAMSGKYRGNKEMLHIRNKFFYNCKQYGYSDHITSEVWRQIESFGGYSFSKAHSASFAVESYQSLYLKTYFPMEFMVAVINNEGGFYSRELYFHELRKTGANVHPPCVNNSDITTNIKGNEVYVGLNRIKNLSREAITTIIAERAENGEFSGLQEFIERTKLGIEQINTLVRIDAFRFTGQSKKNLMWESNFLQKKVKRTEQVHELFKTQPLTFQLPELETSNYEDIYDEIELLGFTLKNVFITADCDTSQFITSTLFSDYKGQTVDVLGYLITTKYVTTKNREVMYFGTFIDSNGDWIDSVHFPKSVDKYPLEGSGFYHMKGKITEEFDVYTIEVEWMNKIGRKQ
jgi:DNA polymerase-3 subunit alpha